MPVFDQGYKHWDGKLSGHAGRWFTITRQGIRVALQGWILRILVLLAMTPAVALIGVFVLWGFLEQQAEWLLLLVKDFLPAEVSKDPGAYRVVVWTLAFRFFFSIELFIAMILVLMVGPGLISQDLRFNAIPLYLSRPLFRWDYFLGKLGVIAYFLALVAIVPALVGYFLGVLFSFKLEVITTTWHLVPGCIGYGLVIVFSAGTLMLALSSLSRSSRYVAAMWIGLWFLSNTVSGVMSAFHVEQTVRQEIHAARQVQPPPLPVIDPMDPDALAGQKQMIEDQHRRRRHDWTQIHAIRNQAFLNDWRPMISYTNNLDRVGRFLLRVDESTDILADQLMLPDTTPAMRDEVRLIFSGPRYPWYWSALVLLALFGASLWLLTTRVRTLDRLS